MNKTLCALVLLLGGALVLAFGSAGAPNASPTSPSIVAKRRLVNQTAPIPTTTIFTPANDGVYRLSVYATLTKSDSSSQSYWYFTLAWTDDAGPENAQSLYEQNGSSAPGQFQLWWAGLSGGLVTIVEAKAGTPITYTMSQAEGPDSSAYNLYYVLEQIE